jgi:peptidoglycan/xylan/chitin deacetylase (PgdA/CDA1 family)
MSGLRALPVLRYHSVAPEGVLAPHGWLERLSEPVELFEATMKDWWRRGVRTVGTAEIVDFLTGQRDLPKRSVVLTFDDGYLDNWVAVAPILKKYGHKAIVFVSRDFIDPSDTVRPTLEEQSTQLQWQGYLSVPEMRAMSESGVAEIQSHARTHTWWFVSPKIIDFYGPHWSIEHPKCRYRFLWLNRHPELKPFALRHLGREAVPWGTPIYEFAPALLARRYEPDPEIESRLVEHVGHAGGEEFFRRSDWRESLMKLVDVHRARYGERGAFESEDQRQQRLEDELAGTRAFLETVTEREVRFFAPPQGGADTEVLKMALRYGYDLVSAPGTGAVRLNRPGAGKGWVYRGGPGYSLFGRSGSMRGAIRFQRLVLARYSGSTVATVLTRTLGIARRLSTTFR